MRGERKILYKRSRSRVVDEQHEFQITLQSLASNSSRQLRNFDRRFEPFLKRADDVPATKEKSKASRCFHRGAFSLSARESGSNLVCCQFAATEFWNRFDRGSQNVVL